MGKRLDLLRLFVFFSPFLSFHPAAWPHQPPLPTTLIGDSSGRAVSGFNPACVCFELTTLWCLYCLLAKVTEDKSWDVLTPWECLCLCWQRYKKSRHVRKFWFTLYTEQGLWVQDHVTHIQSLHQSCPDSCGSKRRVSVLLIPEAKKKLSLSFTLSTHTDLDMLQK